MVTDSDNLSRQRTFNVEVQNVAPAIASDGNVSADEASTATNVGTWGDPGDDDVTLAASIGTVTKNADGTWDWAWDTADGPDESQVVTITATDSDGATSTTSFNLTVDNAQSPDTLLRSMTDNSSGSLMGTIEGQH